MSKLLEKVVACRLTYLTGWYNLILESQFRNRANFSTSDAILTFVYNIYNLWNYGLATFALTFNIKGYFDFVNHEHLLNKIKKYCIPLELVKWTANFFSNQETVICFNGIWGEMKPVKNGIPQGSFISPILVSFYSAGLLDIFETPTNPIEIPKNHACNHPTYVSILMYVDDGKLTVSSQSLDTNNYILAKAYQLVDQWLYSAGLSPDKDKRELMHYTRRKRDKISPHINLINRDGTTSTILVGSTIRWLGVHFDRKLLYNYHVTKMAAKAENAVACISMLANTVRGLSHYHLHLLYCTCILPIITYASAAWWTGKQKHIQILNKVQNRALCLICAAFCTISTYILELETFIPPLSLYLNSLTRHTAIHFNKLSTNNLILQ